jgi:putative membrane protein
MRWRVHKANSEVIAMLGVLAQMMDRGDMGGGGNSWSWIVGLGFVIVLFVLVVVLVVRVATPTQHAAAPPPPVPATRSGEDLLAERLARGEIDAEEYRQRLTALRGG